MVLVLVTLFYYPCLFVVLVHIVCPWARNSLVHSKTEQIHVHYFIVKSATLERQKLVEEVLELSVVDKILNEKTDQRDQEVDRCTKNAEATVTTELEEHERQQKIKNVSE